MRRIHYGKLADVHEVLRTLVLLPEHSSPDAAAILAESLSTVSRILLKNELAEIFDDLGLLASKASLGRLQARLTDPTPSMGAIREAATELNGRLVDELHATTLLALTLTEASRYADAQPFGQSFADAFPSCILDADEAAKCLALGRSTACVMHLMRVMEGGLRALGVKLGIDPQQYRTWEAILGKCHGELSKPFNKRSPAWVADEAFLSEAATTLTAVKVAWRNPSMHLEKTYTPEHAEEIWNAVRIFMQRLATKLHE